MLEEKNKIVWCVQNDDKLDAEDEAAGAEEMSKNYRAPHEKEQVDSFVRQDVLDTLTKHGFAEVSVGTLSFCR